MISNIKKIIFTFFILIVTFLVASEEKIPNVMILENPVKEITTVEGLKNREAADMNIKVKKRNIEEIKGVEFIDKIEFNLPKDSLLKNKEIKVMTSIPKALNKSNISLKNRAYSTISVEIPSVVLDGDLTRVVKILPKDAQNENYIIEFDKTSGEIGRIYKGIVVKSSREIAGGTYNPIECYVRAEAVGGEQTVTESYRIAHQWNAVTEASYGFIDKPISLNRFGSSSDVMSAKFSRVFQLQGDNAPHTNWKFDAGPVYTTVPGGGLHPKNINGGYIMKEVVSFQGGPGRINTGWHYIQGNTDVDNQFRLKIKTTNAGIYSMTPENFSEGGVGWVGFGNKIHRSWFAVPKKFFLLVPRKPKEISINIYKSQLDSNNKISLDLLDLRSSTGYNYSNTKDWAITESTVISGGSISLDNDDIYIPPDVNFGKHVIGVRWYSTKKSPGFKNRDIISGSIDGKHNMDIIMINYLDDRGEIDLGQITFDIDERLTKGKLIYPDGGAKSSRSDSIQEWYPEFVNVNGAFKNLEDIIIDKAISVKNREFKNNNFIVNNIARFDVVQGRDEDASQIPINFNLKDINSKILIESTNSKPLKQGMENNEFIISATNGAIYKGNAKENYKDSKYHSGTAEIDMSELELHTWVRWDNAGVTGSAGATAGDKSVIMKFSDGGLFNLRSAIKESKNKHIVTKLIITDKDGKRLEAKNDSVSSRLEITGFSNHSFGIETNGGFFIHKLSESIIPESYKIEAYYKNISLGTLNLTITNGAEIDMGTVTFEMDQRIQSSPVSWLFQNGYMTKSLAESVGQNYRNMLKIDGDFKNTNTSKIKEVNSMKGRIRNGQATTPSGKKYIQFSSPNGGYKDEGAIPLEIALNQLKENLVISKNNGFDLELLNNSFTLTDSGGKSYKGNVKEKYTGENAVTGTARLDLTEFSVNGWASWSTPGIAKSTATSTGSPINLDFSNGKLFNFKSALNISAGHIVTKLKVTNNAKEITLTSDNLDTESKFPKNRIKMNSDNNGSLIIYKTDYSLASETYTIEAFYNEISLGTLIVTVTNGNGAEDIGQMSYKIDNRLKKKMNELGREWANGCGGISKDKTEWDKGINNPSLQYPLLTEKKGEIRMKFPVLSWEKASERDIKSKSGNKVIFSKKNNPSQEGLALPNTDTSNGAIKDEADFLKYSVFSFGDLNKGRNEKNTLVYKGTDKSDYEFSLDLFVGSEDEFIGEGKINLTELKSDQTYTFIKSSGTGQVSSVENPDVKLNLISGFLPQTQGYTKQNIVESLKVRLNRGSEETIEGMVYTSNPKYNISLDSTTGNLQIKKKSDETYNDIVDIEYFYKDIKLGQITLSISNESRSFEIVGTDVINFGSISRGKQSKIGANIVIKNLKSNKIIDVTLNDNKPIKVLHREDSNIELPITGDVTLLKKGTEVPVRVDLIATPKKDQLVGDYEGELNLYIYIE